MEGHDAETRRGGEQVEMSEFLYEARLMSFAHRLSVLGAWLGSLMPREGDLGEDGIREHRDDVVEHLLGLVDQGEQCSLVS